jgi:hypothetical protein
VTLPLPPPPGPTPPAAGPGWPPPIDLTRRGRALAWCLYGGASGLALLALVASARGSGISFVFVLALAAGYGMAALRASQVRGRAQAALVLPPPDHVVAIEVAVIHPGLQPVWARPRGVLVLGQGRLRLWPLGIDVAAAEVRLRPGPWWGKGGIFVDTPVAPTQRITLVSHFDPATYWGSRVNRPAVAWLETMLAADAARAWADLPAAAWFPDPAGSGRSRWWDGKGWTDHVQ